MTSIQEIHIYTDGACSGNPGPGGWAALIILPGEKEKELWGYEAGTTNNRMEMTAPLEALAWLHDNNMASLPITIYTDSRYVKDGMESWLAGWKRNNWVKSDKQPVKNIEIWQKLDQLTSNLKIQWQWVKGHSGNIGNERVDTLARQAILQCMSL